MKICMIAAATIFIFCSTIDAADDCDSRRLKILNNLKNCKEIEDSEKEKYRVVIEQAYQLCREGKIEEAEEMCKDLREQCLNEAAFGNLHRD